MTYREYLHEDLQLIRRYFPGARTVALVTPFDLTLDPPVSPWSLLADDHSQPPELRLHGDLQWNQ